MRSTHIQDILPLVETPSRYMGGEINTVQKDHHKVNLKVALAFPDLYEIGTSHFGLQILYHILNQRHDILAERVFTPAPDMEAFLRERDLPLQSLESGCPLPDFDIIGFSLLYELNYTNMLGMLEMAKLPLKSEDRDRRHPFIIAGGPCTCNPEPIAAFMDAIVIGDGEKVLLQMAEAWMEWKRKGTQSREGLLDQWSRITGVYVPTHFDVCYDDHGYPQIHALKESRPKVQRTILEDLDAADFPAAPIVPFGRPVHDRLRLELARGCTRGCRFCQAGMIYRPVRERDPATVIQQCEQSLSATGYDDISLLSLSTGDYRCIAPLIEQMIKHYGCDHVALSLPSLRAGTLTPELMQHIKSVRKTGFTIAPEAGSQRLRDVINKNVTFEDIRRTVRDAFELGWNVIKLYFMIGLPTETKEDLEDLVALVKELSQIKGPGGKRKTLNVSVATLIPKPHTPFQWAPQISIDEGWEKITWLKNAMRSPRIRFKWQNPEVSFIEGLMARGDRRVSDLILHAYRKGCRLDGWSDHFRFDLWEESIRELGLDVGSIVHRARAQDEVFPWDHIDMKVKRSFLWEEWQGALRGQIVEDCRDGACQDCGVCDFKAVKPRVYPPDVFKPTERQPRYPSDEEFWQCLITFTKTGLGRFWGHLEMVNIFVRALRRAGITVKFSKGFHPKPKLVFGDALPIGLESLCETLAMTVAADMTSEDIVNRLNAELPDGLSVTDCYPSTKEGPAVERVVTYQTVLHKGGFDPEALKRFEAAEAVYHEKTNRKGQLKKIDLKDMVRRMVRVKPGTLEMDIRQRPGDALLRPDTIMRCAFDLSPEDIQKARVIKLRQAMPRIENSPLTR